MTITFDKKSKNAAVLASKYTRAKRISEIGFVFLFALLFFISMAKICQLFFVRNLWIFLCCCTLSMSLADFFSGIVHWAADTWGTLETPLVGNSFIRSFREHHVDPVAITRHDLFETNGDNCMVTIPILFVTALSTVDTLYDYFVQSFLLLLVFWVCLTNQIHKWSHTYRLPKYVILLMDLGIILSKKDHGIHHKMPFDKYYCITNGWLNPYLASINFWKRLESVITTVVGVVPREDDMLWTGVSARTE